MAIYEWYQQFREENQRQLMEQRRLTDQWIAFLKSTIEAITRSQEEAKSETSQSFEILCELIRGMMPKETTPSVVLEDGVSSSERNQPRIPQEDDRGHPTEDSQATRDNDFALEIEESAEPSQETELEGPTQETEFKAFPEPSMPLPQVGVDGNEAEHVLLEGHPFDCGKDLPEFTVDVPKELMWVKEIAHPIKDMNLQESSEIPKDILVQSISSKDDELKESKNSENGASIEEHLIQVTPNPCEFIKCDGAVKGLGEFVVLLIELMEIRLANSRMDSLDYLRTPSLHKVFAKMPRRGVQLVTGLGVDDSGSNRVSFELRSVGCGTELNQDLIKMPYDRGKSRNEAVSAGFLMVLVEPYNEVTIVKKFVFDSGDIDPLLVRSRGQFYARSSCFLGLIENQILDSILIFDPGGELDNC